MNAWIASANIPQNSVVASDRVNAKQFYGYGQGKFWLSTDGGATFTATAATGLPVAGDSVVVKAMPGHAGDIWIAGGSTGNPYGIWHSTDSGNTFTKLANATAADSIGFGMAAPGQSYMALYTSAVIGGIHGIFRSDDAGTPGYRSMIASTSLESTAASPVIRASMAASTWARTVSASSMVT